MNTEEQVESKMEELREVIKSLVYNHTSNAGEFSERLIESFCVIKPPEIAMTLDFITMKPGGIGGGRSSKRGNIRLNWRKLIVDGSESILTITGAASIPWLIPLAGLVVWNKVWSLLSIEISERHAAVIWIMWNNRDGDNHVQGNKILDLVNEEVLKYNRPMMDEMELKVILKDLEKMHCIKKTDGNKWWLREWVKAVYE